jgi:hypothetical protein
MLTRDLWTLQFFTIIGLTSYRKNKIELFGVITKPETDIQLIYSLF